MKDEFNERPVLPDSGSQDFVIKDVPSQIVHILNGWLEEESQKKKHRVSGDVFACEAQKILYRELGVDGYGERFKQYRDEQNNRLRKWLEYCDKTGEDPDQYLNIDM